MTLKIFFSFYIPHVEFPHDPSTSTDDPTHGKLPFVGAGFEQLRYRYRRPPAHVDEQPVQLPQVDQLPSCGQIVCP